MLFVTAKARRVMNFIIDRTGEKEDADEEFFEQSQPSPEGMMTSSPMSGEESPSDEEGSSSRQGEGSSTRRGEGSPSREEEERVMTAGNSQCAKEEEDLTPFEVDDFAEDDPLSPNFVPARNPDLFNAQLPPNEYRAFLRRKLQRGKIVNSLIKYEAKRVDLSEKIGFSWFPGCDEVGESQLRLKYMVQAYLRNGLQGKFGPWCLLSKNRYLVSQFSKKQSEQKFFLFACYNDRSQSYSSMMEKISDPNNFQKFQFSRAELYNLRKLSKRNILPFLEKWEEVKHGNSSLNEVLKTKPGPISLCEQKLPSGVEGEVFLSVVTFAKDGGGYVKFSFQTKEKTLFSICINFAAFAKLICVAIPFTDKVFEAREEMDRKIVRELLGIDLLPGDVQAEVYKG